jgi:hypothetical protein
MPKSSRLDNLRLEVFQLSLIAEEGFRRSDWQFETYGSFSIQVRRAIARSFVLLFISG